MQTGQVFGLHSAGTPFGYRKAARIFIAAFLAYVLALPAPLQAEEIVAKPATLAPLSAFRDCARCPEMIVMPPGSFMMGAVPGESRNPFDIYGPGASGKKRKPGEINIIPNEEPQVPVEMDIPYAIARNETTQAEWMDCVADGGCTYVPDERVLTIGGYRPTGPGYPVFNVSYLDVRQYIAWLNRKAGAEVYRLPTEAEWEYAARAGTTTRFAQGDELTADQANFSGGATENVRGKPMPGLVDRYMPVPVDELDAANRWGLRHMSGNVYELTLSCWTEQHVALEQDSAYLAAATAEASCIRVAKGGAYTTAMDSLRPARRIRPTEDYRRSFLGFRVVRELRDSAGR